MGDVHLTSTVGYEVVNPNIGDILAVQFLLNKFIISGYWKGMKKPLAAIGTIDLFNKKDETIKAIFLFQEEVVGLGNPDGQILPTGKTLKFLHGPIEDEWRYCFQRTRNANDPRPFRHHQIDWR